MLGSFSIWHWLIVLLVVVLIFGTKKLRNIGQDLGGAVKGFKEGMQEANTDSKSQAASTPDSISQQPVAHTSTTVDVEAREKKN